MDREIHVRLECDYHPVCSNCKAKSADCAYGDLWGGESCSDAIKNLARKQKEVDKWSHLQYLTSILQHGGDDGRTRPNQTERENREFQSNS